MKRIAAQTSLALVVLIAGLLALAPAAAGDKGGQKGKSENQTSETSGSTVRQGEYFTDQRRVVVHEYYTEQFRSGKCPPGLAKKHNGCMPPGQAKKWTMGQPLPRDVVFYEVPPELVVKIGIPPAGYRYARVANDILLIAAGTGMVIDAIQDLGRK